MSSRTPDALATLLEVALELNSERDLNRILQIATSGVCDAVGCLRASLFIYDPQQHELYTRVVTELEINEIRHPLDKGIVGWVATNRLLQSVPVPAEDPRWDRSVDRRTGFRTENILAAPVLSAEGGMLGVLQLLNKSGGFSPLDEQLVQAFAAHVAVALERCRLEEEARLALELRQSLEMGHRIQATFLPSKLPTIPGYEIAAWWHPAEFVSGDYYDWLNLRDGRWGFAISDVSGHGLAAALIMATARAMSHVLARTATDVHDFVETLRASIAPDLQESRFITCCYAVIDPETHRLEWANAGHAPALCYSAQEQTCTRLTATTMPLGFPVIQFPHDACIRTLEPGDVLLLGTDGLVELRDPSGKMYGNERLEACLRSHAQRSASEIVATISRDVMQFHEHPTLPDDATLVIVRRVG